MTDKLTEVRVLPHRSLSLADQAGESDHHTAGDKLQLPADEAAQLIADGFVEKAK